MIDLITINGRSRCNFIYFLCCAADSPSAVYIKIGMSQNPLERLRELATGCGLKIASFGFLGCGCRSETHRIELALHAVFALWRTRGEWYRFELKDKNTFQVLRKETLEKMNTFRWPMKLTMIDVDEFLKKSRHAQGAGKCSKRYINRIDHYRRLHPSVNAAISVRRMPRVAGLCPTPPQIPHPVSM